MEPAKPTTPREWALAYLSRGWSVIQVRRGTKRSVGRWAEFQSRLPTREEVEAWYAQRPDANVAIVTGILSGLIVVDVDPGHGGDSSLRRLERAHSKIPATMTAKTGGGGRHLYFLHPGDELRNRVGVYPGIDVRGDGGYIVAPPSLHPSGKHYVWVRARGPDKIEPAALPQWLLELLRKK